MKKYIDKLEQHWWFRVPFFIFSQFFLPISFTLFAVPLHFIRLLAIYTAPYFRPHYGRPLSPDSGLTTVDDFWTHPKHAVVGMHYTDRPIDKGVVVKRMHQIIQENIFPELAQIMRRWCLYFFWGPCPTFSVENHVTLCYTAKTTEEVRAEGDRLCRKGFLKDQPLWEIVLFPSYRDSEGGSAFALRVHHALADGVAHVHLINAIGGIPPPPQPAPSTLVDWLNYAVQIFKLYLLQYKMSLAFVKDYNFNVWIKREKYRSKEVSFYETHELDLATVKQASKAVGHSVSEVMMVALSQGIRKEMERVGEEVPVSMSAIHPLPKAGHPGTLTNHAYLNSLLLPIGIPDRKEQLQAISEEYKLKRLGAPLANLSCTLCGIFFQVTRWLPDIGPFCSLAVTNFALSSKPWNLFGAEIKRTAFAFEVSQHVPLAVMFIGYRDKMFLWVKGRADVFPTEERPKRIIEHIIEEIKDMANLT